MKKICILGVLIVAILGTLFHFLYQYVPSFIFPKNESIFEHLKLVLFPFLIYGLISIFFIKDDKPRYFASIVSAIVVSMLFVVVSYYVYSGILGFNVMWVDILIFYLAVMLGFYFVYKKKLLFSFNNSIIALIIILICVILFTYLPPDLAFFK